MCPQKNRCSVSGIVHEIDLITFIDDLAIAYHDTIHQNSTPTKADSKMAKTKKLHEY